MNADDVVEKIKEQVEEWGWSRGLIKYVGYERKVVPQCIEAHLSYALIGEIFYLSETPNLIRNKPIRDLEICVANVILEQHPSMPTYDPTTTLITFNDQGYCDNGDQMIQIIEKAAAKLNEQGWHYDPPSNTTNNPTS